MVYLNVYHRLFHNGSGQGSGYRPDCLHVGCHCQGGTFWVNPDPFNPIVRFIHNITEPVLYQIRTRIPVNFGGMDVSPIVVFAVHHFSENICGEQPQPDGTFDDVVF